MSPSSLSASRKSKCHEKPASNSSLSSQNFVDESVAKGAAEAGQPSTSADKHQVEYYAFNRALSKVHEKLNDVEGTGLTASKNMTVH